MDTLARCVSVYFLHPFCTCCLALRLALPSRCNLISGQSQGFAFSTHSHDRPLRAPTLIMFCRVQKCPLSFPSDLYIILYPSVSCLFSINRANSLVLFALILLKVSQPFKMFFSMTSKLSSAIQHHFC